MKNLSIGILFSILFSCVAKENKSTIDSTKSTADTIASATAQDSDLVPKDDEIKEMGLLKEVEDSGYPIATLRIEFPERKFEEYFTVNFEVFKGADINKMRDWVGKYVSFLYKSELENALLDVQVNGKSIFSGEKIELSKDAKRIDGTLQGATEETPGDLPGNVSIRSKDNTSLDFEFFITAEMVKYNNKKVVGIYEERTKNFITSIKLLKK